MTELIYQLALGLWNILVPALMIAIPIKIFYIIFTEAI